MEDEEDYQREYPRKGLDNLMNVVLRIPPIFFLDSLFMADVKLLPSLLRDPNTIHPDNHTNHLDHLSTFGVIDAFQSFFNRTPTPSTSAVPTSSGLVLEKTEDFDYSFILSEFSKIFTSWTNIVFAGTCLLCVILVLCIFILRYSRLVNLYKWMAANAIIFVSYSLNECYFAFLNARKAEGFFSFMFEGKNDLLTWLSFCGLQLVLSIIFQLATNNIEGYFSSYTKTIQFYVFPLLCLTPLTIAGVVPVSPNWIMLATQCSVGIPTLLKMKEVAQDFEEQIELMVDCMRNFGFYALMEGEWERLDVANVLQLFWLTRVALHGLLLLFSMGTLRNLLNEAAATESDLPIALGMLKLGWERFDWQEEMAIAKYLLVRGCETGVAVVGMTAVLSSIITHIGETISRFLPLEDPDDRAIGTVSGVLFFILALQNGLTGMEPEKRIMRLYRNFCLIFTAILHFIHNRVSPILYTLSASRNPSVNKHARALAVCGLVIVFSASFLKYILTHHQLSTWLFAVTAFSVEIIIKVIISLIVYTFFMIDALRSSMWEQLDDYIYYIRAMGNSIEFLFGICLFLNGLFILFFESGGVIRAIMMIIHFYYNIYLQAKEGWKSFSKRRLAAHKINSLKEATPSQLEAFDDVCAICYQELNTARITKCNHYFHSICLRKWLYLQDICPLCHKLLHNIGKKRVVREREPQQQQQVGDRAEPAGDEQPGQEEEFPMERVQEDGNVVVVRAARRSVGTQAGAPHNRPG